MAKVMVSMPDQLLAEVDAEAAKLKTSRSAVLRGYAEAALSDRRRRRAEACEEILKGIEGHPGFGGNSLELLKRDRAR